MQITASTTLASDLQVAPVSLEFAPGAQAEGIWLENTGHEPLYAQLRVFRWSQVQAEEKLEPSDELVVSPPIAQVAPGTRQFVRLVRTAGESVVGEHSYRVVVDELPAPGTKPAKGLRFLLRYSIPVFVLPDGATPRRAATGPTQTDLSQIGATVEEREGKIWLSVTNHGRQRVRLSELALTNTQGSDIAVVPGLLGYVLSGERMQWPLTVSADQIRNGTLKARFNDDQQARSVPMDRR